MCCFYSACGCIALNAIISTNTFRNVLFFSVLKRIESFVFEGMNPLQ